MYMMYGMWRIAVAVSFAVLTQCFPEDDLVTHSRYACNAPPSCQSNLYSIECSAEEKIAMKSVSYGAKPVTSFCPSNNQLCISKNTCCHHENGDCLTAFKDFELLKIYEDCSYNVQCGWLFASSITMTGQCKVREKSNYIKADFKCVHTRDFIDACSQLSVTARSVHIHHSAIPPNSDDNKQCSCIISPDICNTTATVIFHSVDIRLHNRNNLTSCSPGSRIELIGQRKSKTYSCQEDKFLHGFEVFHISSENNMVLYLHKQHMVYPTRFWLEVKASLSEVNVKVTCGPRSVETATRCPALSITRSGIVDVVEELPSKNGDGLNIIHINPEDIDEKLDHQEPSEKHNPAFAAIIGGIVAGVVMVIILLVVCILMVRRKRNKMKQAMPSPHCAEETHQFNMYETVNDPDCKVHTSLPIGVVYHPPWGIQPGMSCHRHGKPADLAYATSEEIKVLIEKMKQEPDPTYYRHISTFTFLPIDNTVNDGTPLEKVRPEAETDSLVSNQCDTEKLESEDSKVEADQCIDSDVELQRVEAEGAEAGYDGYESPRVSSCQLPNNMESVRENIMCDQSKLKNYVYQPENVCVFDFDVPDELAPPVSEAVVKQQSQGLNTTNNQSYKSSNSDNSQTESNEPLVKLGSYREPKGKNDQKQNTSDSESECISDHPYSPVYDEITDQHTKL